MAKFITVKGKTVDMLADQLNKAISEVDNFDVMKIEYLPQPGQWVAIVLLMGSWLNDNKEQI